MERSLCDCGLLVIGQVEQYCGWFGDHSPHQRFGPSLKTGDPSVPGTALSSGSVLQVCELN